MSKFLTDLNRGMTIGFKLSLTVYFMAAVFCVAFTGFGLAMAPVMVCEGLDLIWGTRTSN